MKELNTMFECHLEKDKSILEVVQNIRERLNLDDIYFDMYNPKDSEKEHIYQLLKQEFDSNKETEALSGLEPTIKKLEEVSKKYGMSKSGLVNLLINQVSEKGTIY